MQSANNTETALGRDERVMGTNYVGVGSSMSVKESLEEIKILLCVTFLRWCI